LVKTPEDAKIPILLRFWDISQLRYTNSQLGNDSYHLGAVRPVTRRNDISLNRNMFQFSGYIWFDLESALRNQRKTAFPKFRMAIRKTRGYITPMA
jgi:hypothetical protein